MIDSDWLVAFRALADHGTFASAAKRLHLSQPAVHQKVKRLTEAVGVALYRRSGRGILLTSEGREVAAFARDLDDRTRSLLAHLRGGADAGPLVLAAGTGAILYVLGEGLRRFVGGKSGRVDVVTADATTSVELVRRGGAHVGVAVLDAPPRGLTSERVTEVEQVLVVPRHDVLAKKRTVALSDLSGRRLVVPPAGRPHREMLEAALAARDVPWEAGAQASGWELMVRLVAVGAGVAVVNGTSAIPRGLVARPMKELPKVRYLVFTREDAPREVVRLRAALAAFGDAWRAGRG